MTPIFKLIVACPSSKDNFILLHRIKSIMDRYFKVIQNNQPGGGQVMGEIWEDIVIAVVIGYMFLMSYQTYALQKEYGKKMDILIRHFELDSTMTEIEDELLNKYLIEGEKNKAIRRYRELTNYSLLEALEYVDARLNSR